MTDFNQLVREIADTRKAINVFYKAKQPAPAPRPPAPAKDLSALTAHLRRQKLPFPPSYRAFLTAHNGVEAFDGRVNLLSAQEIMAPVDPALTSDFPTLSRFIIGMGNTPAFISFDPETANAAGEMEVVWVMPEGREYRYPNFAAFLEMVRDELAKTLGQEQADRKRLRP